MKLPTGRLYGSKLVMPRIGRGLYNNILEAARLAEKREKARMEAAVAEESVQIRSLIAEAETALAEFREKRKRGT
jgi:uncharacterized protein (DUF2336 family)